MPAFCGPVDVSCVPGLPSGMHAVRKCCGFCSRRTWPGVGRGHAGEMQGNRGCPACAGAQDDKRMLTASGDQCVHLWDTGSARGLGQFRGHNGSVKSVCPHASHPAIFASGAPPAQSLAHQPQRFTCRFFKHAPSQVWHNRLPCRQPGLSRCWRQWHVYVLHEGRAACMGALLRRSSGCAARCLIRRAGRGAHGVGHARAADHVPAHAHLLPGTRHRRAGAGPHPY